jgi:hypothetical protein
MQTIYTIIDVIPPTGGVEYLIVSEAPSVPQDASESKPVPKDAEWQRRTGKRYLLLRKENWEDRDAYLLEVERIGETGMMHGVYWARDRYGWQLVSSSCFNPTVWQAEEVDVVFDPDLDPDSVRIIR